MTEFGTVMHMGTVYFWKAATIHCSPTRTPGDQRCQLTRDLFVVANFLFIVRSLRWYARKLRTHIDDWLTAHPGEVVMCNAASCSVGSRSSARWNCPTPRTRWASSRPVDSRTVGHPDTRYLTLAKSIGVRCNSTTADARLKVRWPHVHTTTCQRRHVLPLPEYTAVCVWCKLLSFLIIIIIFFMPTSTKPRAWKLSKNNGCVDFLFGVHCVEEGDRIPPLQSYGQALKQKSCFSGVLSDDCGASANLLD